MNDGAVARAAGRRCPRKSPRSPLATHQRTGTCLPLDTSLSMAIAYRNLAPREAPQTATRQSCLHVELYTHVENGLRLTTDERHSSGDSRVWRPASTADQRPVARKHHSVPTAPQIHLSGGPGRSSRLAPARDNEPGSAYNYVVGAALCQAAGMRAQSKQDPDSSSAPTGRPRETLVASCARGPPDAPPGAMVIGARPAARKGTPPCLRQGAR